MEQSGQYDEIMRFRGEPAWRDQTLLEFFGSKYLPDSFSFPSWKQAKSFVVSDEGRASYPTEEWSEAVVASHRIEQVVNAYRFDEQIYGAEATNPTTYRVGFAEAIDYVLFDRDNLNAVSTRKGGYCQSGINSPTKRSSKSSTFYTLSFWRDCEIKAETAALTAFLTTSLISDMADTSMRRTGGRVNSTKAFGGFTIGSLQRAFPLWHVARHEASFGGLLGTNLPTRYIGKFPPSEAFSWFITASLGIGKTASEFEEALDVAVDISDRFGLNRVLEAVFLSSGTIFDVRKFLDSGISNDMIAVISNGSRSVGEPVRRSPSPV